MSNDPPDDAKKPAVVSDDGKVDRELKTRIIELRKMVDDREDALFTLPIIDPDVNVDHREAVAAWGGVVRRYLRGIEPILVQDDIQHADHYYKHVDLGTVELVPPDKNGVQWSKFALYDVDDATLKQEMGLNPQADPPTAYTHTFTGLGMILKEEVVANTWTVNLNNGVGASADIVHLENAKPIPKYILENAVRHADQFLQDAGIGLEIGSGRDIHNYSE